MSKIQTFEHHPLVNQNKMLQTAAKIESSIERSLLLSQIIVQVIALNVFTKKTLKIL